MTTVPQSGRLVKLSFAFAALAYCPIATLAGAAEPPRKASRPNVVLIIVDELGYQFVGANGGLTCRGIPIHTPNIDALAETGVRWTHAHARAMCSPTRQTLMTGKHGFRYPKPKLETIFIPKLMKRAGYTTGHVGKWMMGPLFNPSLKGYDEAAIYCGQYQFHDPQVMTFNARGYLSEFNQPTSVKRINGGDMHCATVDNVYKAEHATVLKGQFGPDVMNRWACDFITRHKENPFFLYYATKLAHIRHPKIPRVDAEPSYANSVNYVDTLVGQIIEALELAGVRDNTLILFVGDNGHKDSPADKKSIAKGQLYLPGTKGGLYEGATRVPFIANWTAGGASGVVRDELMCITDLLPTCVAAAGAELPSDDTFDGVSLLPQIRGEQGNPREWVYIDDGSHPNIVKGELSQFYDGVPKAHRRYVVGTRYKLLWDGRFYDLQTDIDETHDISLGTGSPDAETARATLQKVLDDYAEQIGPDFKDPTLVPKAEVIASTN
ncbi:sulfatase-like hydrolase/transferase [Stratiformator vulcanicus]|uniref:Arylsulfatase n=1 Tax=Stratiformator vulcanicus TaxID=2527980 RepID=A0A517QWU0_9PLAN|nr:sulfatase-like hydrolase/transferase [Stratiformator vulcanicus]QDT36057.1 Arylsulfatase [Stratiformator vulcanicus]